MGRNSQLYKRASRSGSSDSVRPHRKTLRARVVACCSLLEYDRVFRRTFRGRTSPFGGSRHAAHPLGPGYGTTKRHTNAPPRPSTPGTHQRHGSGPVLSLAVPAHHCSGGPDTRRILWDPGMVQRSGTRMHRHVPPHPEPINATGQVPVLSLAVPTTSLPGSAPVRSSPEVISDQLGFAAAVSPSL